jgi:hypothetical protein
MQQSIQGMPYCRPGDSEAGAKIVFRWQQVALFVNTVHDLLPQNFIELSVLGQNTFH